MAPFNAALKRNSDFFFLRNWIIVQKLKLMGDFSNFPLISGDVCGLIFLLFWG